MSINAIGHISGYGGNYPGLSEETKRKLIALGIDPSTVTSEAQAQVLIENALLIRKSAKVPQPANLNAGEQELISRAKTLASKMGISVSNMTPLEQIMKAIAAKIESGEFEEYKSEFHELTELCASVKQNENAMFASMNYNAVLNKMMLGL